jgi:lysophospholipase L1-like esterase
VAVIDLQESSGALFAKLGDAGSTDLSCELKDRTHFSPKGAQAMAELVIKELREVEPRLQPYWRN